MEFFARRGRISPVECELGYRQFADRAGAQVAGDERGFVWCHPKLDFDTILIRIPSGDITGCHKFIGCRTIPVMSMHISLYFTGLEMLQVMNDRDVDRAAFSGDSTRFLEAMC